MKKFFYIIFVRNKLSNFIAHPAVSSVIPPVVGLYYGTLDIWGNEWDVVKNHVETHQVIFTILAGATLFVLFFKGIREFTEGAVTKKYQELTQAILEFFNTLVKKKRDRFFNKARKLKPKGDIFKAITHPKDQLEHVLDGTKELLSKGFGINRKNISITVIQGNLKDDTWFYAMKCDQQKQHTKAKRIMTESSAAKYCFDTGDSLFLADIRDGVKGGIFYPSERSSSAKTGSLFCKPVRITVSNVEFVYIFTIAVYGTNLCTPYDENECVACEKILDEVADRVELELYLYSIKQYKDTPGAGNA
ncbi:hypothetical protein [Pseudidiomarina gelatinasegens]|uniref:hypothetical protein n=1 Tax=Pseudidiomarina gelatinasegens TaxID=2487740 RepID=UPI003A987B5D